VADAQTKKLINNYKLINKENFTAGTELLINADKIVFSKNTLDS